MEHQFEGLATIAAAGISFFDGQLRAVQHAQSKDLFRVMLDGPEEADAHLRHVLGLGNVPRRSGIEIGVCVVEVIGRCKLGVGAQIVRLPRIGRNYPVLGRSRGMRATSARSLAHASDGYRSRILSRNPACLLRRILLGILSRRWARRADQAKHEDSTPQPSLAHDNYSLLLSAA
jgi:hypothetical protein